MLLYGEYKELDKQRRRNVCAVCGGFLNLFKDDGRIFLACANWPSTHHEGIQKILSSFDKKGMEALNFEARRKIMTEKYGDKGVALEKYQSTAIITRDVAAEIVGTLWGDAPAIEKQKTILLCATYNLNPLMNHVFMLPFNDKAGKTKWVVALGIEATRLMAHRKHNFTYLDMTPRIATEDELIKVLGKTVDKDTVYSITKIKDLDIGAESYGIGAWKGGVYGSDKGNTALNMASIRSERQAMKRLYPAEMPTDVDVIDERFASAVSEGAIDGECKVVEVGDTKVVEATGEVIEDNSPPSAISATLVAAGLDDMFAPKAPAEKYDTTPVVKADVDRLKEVMLEAGQDLEDIGRLCTNLQWNIRGMKDLKKWQVNELIRLLNEAIGKA